MEIKTFQQLEINITVRKCAVLFHTGTHDTVSDRVYLFRVHLDRYSDVKEFIAKLGITKFPTMQFFRYAAPWKSLGPDKLGNASKFLQPETDVKNLKIPKSVIEFNSIVQQSHVSVVLYFVPGGKTTATILDRFEALSLQNVNSEFIVINGDHCKHSVTFFN